MNDAQKKLAWFGALGLAAILIISFVPTAFRLGNYEFRKVDFASEVKKNSVAPSANDSREVAGKNAGSKADSSSGSNNPNQAKGSNPAIVLPDFLSHKEIINYSPTGAAPVSKFIQAVKDLQAGKRKIVRVAYLGDSFIEGDIITQDLRQLLQDQFGGNGVGFVPINSISSGFRQTVVHSYSKDWTDFNFKSSGDRSNVFISGHNFTSGGDSWVSYAAVKHPHLDSFENAYLLYKSTEPLNLTVNGTAENQPAAPQMGNVLIASHTKKVTFSTASPATLYGVSLEPESGMLVDNFSFRGISGIEMQYITPELLLQINTIHPYDLIIFQYGPNLLFKPNIDNFDFYVKPMVKGVSQFRDAFPQADVLMVSTGDKAFRYNGQYATATGVIPLLKVQQQVAQQTGVNFWNFFLNMGGEGSMIQWVEGDTTFANKDYTHVNFKGGKKIATLLFNALMNAYNDKK